MSASNHKVGSPINVWQSLANTFINQSTNLKQWWDQVGEIVRVKHDALCDYIDTDIATKSEVQNITLGQITDGTITTAKLDPDALQANVTKLTTATGNLYGVTNVDDALSEIKNPTKLTLPIVLYNAGTVNPDHAVAFLGRDGVNVNTGTALYKQESTGTYFGQGYSFHMIKPINPRLIPTNGKVRVTYTASTTGIFELHASQVPPCMITDTQEGNSFARDLTPTLSKVTMTGSATSTNVELALNPIVAVSDFDDDIYIGVKMSMSGVATHFMSITKVEIIQG